tara:strand:+ start:2516 stop:2779 length:264 start_codon:yes stop_codon:yes gene_type:complete
MVQAPQPQCAPRRCSYTDEEYATRNSYTAHCMHAGAVGEVGGVGAAGPQELDVAVQLCGLATAAFPNNATKRAAPQPELPPNKQPRL